MNPAGVARSGQGRGSCYDPTMERRSDYKTALLIEATIHEAEEQNRSPARALAALGVPFEVTMRMLTRPDERRHVAPLPRSAEAQG